MNRFEILGSKVSETNFKDTVTFFKNYNYSNTGYVCLSDFSVIVAAEKDHELQKILNQSLLTLPDGKPIEFFARLKGYKKVTTVSGYWLIKELFQTPLKHYFYGCNPECLERIVSRLQKEHSDSKIFGYKAPPLLSKKNIKGNKDLKNDVEIFNNLQPDIIWIGISSPKQDYLMHELQPMLNHGLMIGVGGVFDYLAGTKKISPEWVKKIGFRWFYRFIQEPRRLYKRYLITSFGIIKLVFILIKSGINRNIHGNIKP